MRVYLLLPPQRRGQRAEAGEEEEEGVEAGEEVVDKVEGWSPATGRLWFPTRPAKEDRDEKK